MSKGILTKEEAEKVVVAYSPRKFPMTISPAAVDFIQFQSKSESTGFQIDKLVAEQTGVAELERVSIEERVEHEALARLKDLQEQAYQQAYQLGLDEGREKAFQEARVALSEKIEHMGTLLASIENVKSELVNFNESHFVKLAFYMAKRLFMEEISADPEKVINILRHAIEGAQSEEEITLRVSPSDFEFVESMKEKLGKDFDQLKRAKVEASEDIKSGGCIVETNYGDVDATIERRLEKLWTAVTEKLPKVKDTIGDQE